MPTLERNVAAIRGQLSSSSISAPGNGAASIDGQQPRLAGRAVADRLPAGHRQALHGPVHAREGLGQVRLDRGLSFTEFSYMLLRAYDFWHLHRTMGVELQMGGADQWGNITAGLELIRRTSGVGEDAPDQPAHGLAYKLLLLSPSGTKFGKSVSGDAIWLDPAKTSRSRSTSTGSTPTIGMSARTCWFTEMDRGEIERLEAELAARPEARGAQRALARDITARTHGEAAAAQAEGDSEALFWRTDPGSGAAGIAVRVHRWIHVHVGGGGGRCGSLARRRGCRCVARRGAG